MYLQRRKIKKVMSMDTEHDIGKQEHNRQIDKEEFEKIKAELSI
jgi:hypothetical protein